jgi:hypothetical protein
LTQPLTYQMDQFSEGAGQLEKCQRAAHSTAQERHLNEGLFWTNKPGPEIFVCILDYLFEVSGEQAKSIYSFISSLTAVEPTCISIKKISTISA